MAAQSRSPGPFSVPLSVSLSTRIEPRSLTSNTEISKCVPSLCKQGYPITLCSNLQGTSLFCKLYRYFENDEDLMEFGHNQPVSGDAGYSLRPAGALLHKASDVRGSPFPGRNQLTAIRPQSLASSGAAPAASWFRHGFVGGIRSSSLDRAAECPIP